MNFALKTRNCASKSREHEEFFIKTRNFVLHMMNFADHDADQSAAVHNRHAVAWHVTVHAGMGANHTGGDDAAESFGLDTQE